MLCAQRPLSLFFKTSTPHFGPLSWQVQIISLEALCGLKRSGSKPVAFLHISFLYLGSVDREQTSCIGNFCPRYYGEVSVDKLCFATCQTGRSSESKRTITSLQGADIHSKDQVWSMCDHRLLRASQYGGTPPASRSPVRLQGLPEDPHSTWSRYQCR
jgi:hypothetical protein